MKGGIPKLVDHVLSILQKADFEQYKVRALKPILARGSDKMSKHAVAAGDGNALLALLRQLAAKVLARVCKPAQIVSIHEAGFDGFSVHRLLEKNGVDSHVVDPASIAVPRRVPRVKTDGIDGETLLRTLTAQHPQRPEGASRPAEYPI